MEKTAEKPTYPTVEEYKEHLRSICIRHLARSDSARIVADVYQAIAEELLKELITQGERILIDPDDPNKGTIEVPDNSQFLLAIRERETTTARLTGNTADLTDLAIKVFVILLKTLSRPDHIAVALLGLQQKLTDTGLLSTDTVNMAVALRGKVQTADTIAGIFSQKKKI